MASARRQDVSSHPAQSPGVQRSSNRPAQSQPTQSSFRRTSSNGLAPDLSKGKLGKSRLQLSCAPNLADGDSLDGSRIGSLSLRSHLTGQAGASSCSEQLGSASRPDRVSTPPRRLVSLNDMPEDVLLLICSDETMSIGRMGGACLALLASTCQYYRRLKLPGGSGLSLVEEASKDLVLRWHCPLQPKAMLAHRFANEWRWTQTLSWFGSATRVPADYCTIQEAIDATPSGGCILVDGGEYPETLRIAHAELSLIGTGRDGPAIVSCPDPHSALLFSGAVGYVVNMHLRQYAAREDPDAMLGGGLGHHHPFHLLQDDNDDDGGDGGDGGDGVGGLQLVGGVQLDGGDGDDDDGEEDADADLSFFDPEGADEGDLDYADFNTGFNTGAGPLTLPATPQPSGIVIGGSPPSPGSASFTSLSHAHAVNHSHDNAAFVPPPPEEGEDEEDGDDEDEGIGVSVQLQEADGTDGTDGTGLHHGGGQQQEYDLEQLPSTPTTPPIIGTGDDYHAQLPLNVGAAGMQGGGGLHGGGGGGGGGGMPLSNDYVAGVAVTSGSLTLESCFITSIAIYSSSQAHLLNSTVSDSPGMQCGVFILQGGEGILEGNEILHHACAGVEINQGGCGRLKNNTIRDNLGSGVLVSYRSLGELTANHIHSNGGNGCEVDEGGKANITACHIRGNGKYGCVIYDRAEVVIRECHIHDCSEGGVQVYESGRCTLTECDIRGHGYCGVEIFELGDCILSRNHIRDCVGAGVWVCDHGRATLQSNYVHGSQLSGVVVSTGGDATLEGNHIYDCKQNGVYVTEDGRATLVDNVIHHNYFTGLELSDCGVATLHCPNSESHYEPAAAAPSKAWKASASSASSASSAFVSHNVVSADEEQADQVVTEGTTVSAGSSKRGGSVANTPGAVSVGTGNRIHENGLGVKLGMPMSAAVLDELGAEHRARLSTGDGFPGVWCWSHASLRIMTEKPWGQQQGGAGGLDPSEAKKDSSSPAAAAAAASSSASSSLSSGDSRQTKVRGAASISSTEVEAEAERRNSTPGGLATPSRSITATGTTTTTCTASDSTSKPAPPPPQLRSSTLIPSDQAFCVLSEATVWGNSGGCIHVSDDSTLSVFQAVPVVVPMSGRGGTGRSGAVPAALPSSSSATPSLTSGTAPVSAAASATELPGDAAGGSLEASSHSLRTGIAGLACTSMDDENNEDVATMLTDFGPHAGAGGGAAGGGGAVPAALSSSASSSSNRSVKYHATHATHALAVAARAGGGAGAGFSKSSRSSNSRSSRSTMAAAPPSGASAASMETSRMFAAGGGGGGGSTSVSPAPAAPWAGVGVRVPEQGGAAATAVAVGDGDPVGGRRSADDEEEGSADGGGRRSADSLGSSPLFFGGSPSASSADSFSDSLLGSVQSSQSSSSVYSGGSSAHSSKGPSPVSGGVAAPPVGPGAAGAGGRAEASLSPGATCPPLSCFRTGCPPHATKSVPAIVRSSQLPASGLESGPKTTSTDSTSRYGSEMFSSSSSSSGNCGGQPASSSLAIAGSRPVCRSTPSPLFL